MSRCFLKSWKDWLDGKFDLLSVSLWKLTFWRLLLMLLGLERMMKENDPVACPIDPAI